MRLTSVLMLALGYWMLFAAHALGAGRQHGSRFPWDSPPPSPLSWDHTKKGDYHAMTGHTGTKDKGIASVSRRQDQDAHSSSSSEDDLSSGASYIFNQVNDELDVPNVRTLAQWNLDDNIDFIYGSSTLGPGQHSTLGEWDDQLMEDQLYGLNAWPGQRNDLSSQLTRSDQHSAQHATSYQPSDAHEPQSYHHLHSMYAQWLGHHPHHQASNAPPLKYDSEQHLSHSQTGQDANNHPFHLPQSGYSEVPSHNLYHAQYNYVSKKVKCEWQAFNKMLMHNFRNAVSEAIYQDKSIDVIIAGVSKGILYKAPRTWFISVVDNLFGAIEQRGMFNEAPLREFVSSWANQKRNQLALDRGSDELDFMKLDDKPTRKWIMKGDYTASNGSKINNPPAIWFSEYAKPNPVLAFIERKEKDANEMRMRRRKKAAEKRRRVH